MPVPAQDNAGIRPVVGEEENNRVVPGIHGTDLVKHPPDFPVHAIDHRGMHRHLGCLVTLLFVGQGLPGQRMFHLARPERGEPFLLEIPRGKRRFERGQVAIDDAHPAEVLPAFLAFVVPALEKMVAVAGDILGRRMQREVRRDESEIREERLIGVLLRMLFQAIDRMIGDGGGGVVSTVFFHGRLALVIDQDTVRIEIPVVIFETVGPVEPAVGDPPLDVVHMPLAGMIGTVAGGFEQVGQGARP